MRTYRTVVFLLTTLLMSLQAGAGVNNVLINETLPDPVCNLTPEVSSDYPSFFYGHELVLTTEEADCTIYYWIFDEGATGEDEHWTAYTGPVKLPMGHHFVSYFMAPNATLDPNNPLQDGTLPKQVEFYVTNRPGLSVPEGTISGTRNLKLTNLEDGCYVKYTMISDDYSVFDYEEEFDIEKGIDITKTCYVEFSVYPPAYLEKGKLSYIKPVVFKVNYTVDANAASTQAEVLSDSWSFEEYYDYYHDWSISGDEGSSLSFQGGVSTSGSMTLISNSGLFPVATLKKVTVTAAAGWWGLLDNPGCSIGINGEWKDIPNSYQLDNNGEVRNYGVSGDFEDYTFENVALNNGVLTINVQGVNSGGTIVRRVQVEYELEKLGLSVAGVEVTTGNQNDILGDGKVSFSSENSTLTLNGATINGSITTGLESLTVSFSGENHINTTDAAFVALKGSNTTPKVSLSSADNSVLFFSSTNAVSNHGDGVELSVSASVWTSFGSKPDQKEWICAKITVKDPSTFDSSMDANKIFFVGDKPTMSYTVSKDYSVVYRATGPGYNGDYAVYASPITLSEEVGKYNITARAVPTKYVGYYSNGEPLFRSSVYLNNRFDICEKPVPSLSEGTYEGVQYLTFSNIAEGYYLYYGERQASGGYAFSAYEEGKSIEVSKDMTLYYYLGRSGNNQTFSSDWLTVAYIINPITEYPLKVADKVVTVDNAADIFGDGTVSYDAKTQVLTLANALILGTIDTAVDGLTIHLVGENTISTQASEGINYAIRNTSPKEQPVTFTTTESQPGSLSVYAPSICDLSGVTLSNFQNGLTLQYKANGVQLIAVPITTEGKTDEEVAQQQKEQNKYRIWVGDVQITEANHLNVLGQIDNNGNPTVLFDDDNDLLVLHNAALATHIRSIREEGLKVFLAGNNSIDTGTEPSFLSLVNAKAQLTFLTDVNKPGRLVLSTPIYTEGFTTRSYQNGLGLTSDNVTGQILIAPVGVVPIVDEEKTFTSDAFLVQEGGTSVPVDLSNTEIDDVLYTLGDATSVDGFDAAVGEDDDPGIVLFTQMSNSTVNQLVLDPAVEPGSDAYAEAFTGLTFKVPAGTGDILIDSKVVGTSTLTIKVGEGEPVACQHADREVDTLRYACAEPTYVYVYNASPVAGASRRTFGPFPIGDKKSTTHVKVYSVNVKVGAMISSTALASTEQLSAGGPMLEKCVSVLRWDNSYYRRDASGRVLGIKLDKVLDEPVTEVEDDLFSGVDQKRDVRYIDMSETEVSGLNVASTEARRRAASNLFGGFDEQTLIYLPEGNADGGRPNVIIDGTCARLSLDGQTAYLAPRDFTAREASLNRQLTVHQPAAVILPFSLSADKASQLGTFHELKAVSFNRVTFGEPVQTTLCSHTPYLYIPAETAASFNFSDVEIAHNEAMQYGGLFLSGTYEPYTIAADVPVYQWEADGTAFGAFVRQTSGTTISPFDAWLTVYYANDRLQVQVEGREDLGIHTVGHAAEADLWYTLDGRPIARPNSKGIYIRNGQKTVVR